MNDQQPPTAADPEVMHTWLTSLFAHADAGYLSVAAGFGNKLESEFFPASPAGIAEAVSCAMRYDRRKPQGIYVQSSILGERPPSGKRGGEEAVRCLTHLWADGDYGTVGHKPGPDDLPAPPDPDAVAKVVHESGLPAPSGWSYSGGGYNPVWLLAEVYVIDGEEARQRAKVVTTGLQNVLAAQAYRCGWSWDSGVGNLDRLMKLPGSVNRKDGLERPTAIGPGTGEVFEFADLAEAVARLEPAARETLEQATQEKRERNAARLGRKIPPPRAPRAPRPSSGDGPLDVLADELEFADVLEPAGFTYEGVHGDGRQKWKRPAGVGGTASSAYSLLCDDHVAVNWSERSDLPVGALPPGNKLTIGTLYAHLNYGGDTSEAARDIMRAAAGKTAQGPASRLPPTVLAEVKRRCLKDSGPTQEAPADDPWDRPQDEPSEDTDGQLEIPPTQLPLEFWDSRESLKSIRRLAHSKLLPADTTLGAIMARVSGAIPHTFTAESPMGRASLNLPVAMIGGPSAGKSQSARAAREAFSTPDRLMDRDSLPIGSGEGLTEIFMGTVEEPTGEIHQKGPHKGDPVMVAIRRQIHHNAFVYVDEGKSIGDIEERNGSTLGETIRRAAMGEALGQTNATQERKRYVAPMSYAMGVLVGLQPSIATTLLKDSGTGTPQRFLWLWARDVTIPDQVVEHPGTITIPGLDASYDDGSPVAFRVPDEVAAEMRQKRLRAVRSGGIDDDELNGHEPVMKMKFAALLAIIDGRFHMTLEDWRLAGILWATSCAVRDDLVGLAQREAAAARRAAEEAEIELATRKGDALDKAEMRREARLRKALDHLASAGGRMSRTELIRAFHSRYRGELPDVIERGVAKGVLQTFEEDGDWWVRVLA